MVLGELENYRKDAITAATELTYSNDVIYKLEKATTISQIGNIMKQARLDSSDRDIKRNSTRKNNKVSNEKN